MSATPSIGAIKTSVAAQFGCSVLDLESERRERGVSRPRQVGMYLAKEMTPHSLADIGRFFGGRDHTTVMHACRKVVSLMDEDDRWRLRVDGLRDSIERFSDIVPGTGSSLEEIARWAMHAAVRACKAGEVGIVQGNHETMLDLLQELAGEEPAFTARKADGSQLQFLVSPEGSWSRIEIHGETATLVEGGAEWRPF